MKRSILDLIDLVSNYNVISFFFFQAEDGIRDLTVTGVQTCALPICRGTAPCPSALTGFDVCQTDFGQTGFSPVCPRLAVCQKTVLRASVSARDRSTENSYCRSLENRVSKGPERSPLQPNWELGGGREDTISGLNV